MDGEIYMLLIFLYQLLLILSRVTQSSSLTELTNQIKPKLSVWFSFKIFGFSLVLILSNRNQD